MVHLNFTNEEYITWSEPVINDMIKNGFLMRKIKQGLFHIHVYYDYNKNTDIKKYGFIFRQHSHKCYISVE